MAWSIYRQLKGKDHRRFAQPYCSQCRSNLREEWDDSMHCHQCGQSLENPFNVYFGKKSKPLTRKRIWLRTLLVIVLFLLYYALLHWFLFHDSGNKTWALSGPRLMPWIVFPIAMILGTVINLRSGRNFPQISHPYCSECNYDLRVNWRDVKHCPECGQDLAKDDAVYFGRSPIRSQNKNFHKFAMAIALVFILFGLGVNLYDYLVKQFRAKPVAVPVSPITPTPTTTTITATPTPTQTTAGHEK
jgi:predicted RNA-binding Zn-ribbon protein involved in translation (DUF1610 family)